MAEASSASRWNVTLPKKAASSFELRRPLAELALADGSRRQIPVEVAKRLLAKGDAAKAWSDEELLAELRRMEESLAWEKTAGLLNRRDYTSSELRERLLLRGYSQDAVTSALERARKKRLVDDARFAETFAQAKIRQGWGKKKIVLELRRRGIEPSGARFWEIAEEEGSEEERAFELASRKHVSAGNEYQKLVRYLAGRGYSFETASKAASRALAERGLG